MYLQPVRRKSSDSVNSNEEESDTEPSPTMLRQGRRKAIFDSRVSSERLYLTQKSLFPQVELKTIALLPHDYSKLCSFKFLQKSNNSAAHTKTDNASFTSSSTCFMTLRLPWFNFCSLSRRVPQSDGLGNKLKGKNRATVVQSTCVLLAESAIFIFLCPHVFVLLLVNEA